MTFWHLYYVSCNRPLFLKCHPFYQEHFHLTYWDQSLQVVFHTIYFFTVIESIIPGTSINISKSIGLCNNNKMQLFRSPTLLSKAWLAMILYKECITGEETLKVVEMKKWRVFISQTNGGISMCTSWSGCNGYILGYTLNNTIIFQSCSIVFDVFKRRAPRAKNAVFRPWVRHTLVSSLSQPHFSRNVHRGP